MRAIVIREHGGPEVLRIEEVEEPTPKEGQCLVDVLVAGINHYDINQRMGAGGEPPIVPGVDAVGVRRDTGQRVLVTGASGTYAEVMAAREDKMWLVPEKVSDEAAVALGVPYRAAWAGLAELESGGRLLVQGGGSSTGQASIDIGRSRGATVFATTSQGKLARLAALDGVNALTYDDDEVGRLEANVVFDSVGGESFTRSVEALGKGGVVVTPGAVGDFEVSFNIWTLVARRGRIEGIPASNDPNLPNELLDLLAQGKLSPQIDSILPLEQAAEAHRRIEARETFGKVVLRVR